MFSVKCRACGCLKAQRTKALGIGRTALPTYVPTVARPAPAITPAIQPKVLPWISVFVTSWYYGVVRQYKETISPSAFCASLSWYPAEGQPQPDVRRNMPQALVIFLINPPKSTILTSINCPKFNSRTKLVVVVVPLTSQQSVVLRFQKPVGIALVPLSRRVSVITRDRPGMSVSQSNQPTSQGKHGRGIHVRYQPASF